MRDFLPILLPNIRRKSLPKTRIIPVRTIYVPHTNKATDDNNSINININYPSYLSTTNYIHIDSFILAFATIYSLYLKTLLKNVIFFF